MTPTRSIALGSLVLVAAIVLAGAGAALRGPLDPECDKCAPIVSRGLLLAALPVAILGAVLVAMGLARREAPPENVQEADPPSPRDERAP